MIFVGIDDTDVLGAPGTNQLAKRLVIQLIDRYQCHLILRHQLLVDDRVPYTSKNSSATLILTARVGTRDDLNALFDQMAEFITQFAADGSDPGLCLGTTVPQFVSDFGYDCKSKLSNRDQAHDVADAAGLRLAGLGGTQDGVIGAVAAIGLAATGNDGRVVMIEGRDDLSGICSITELAQRDVEVRCHATNRVVRRGQIDVGKHLRPNIRGGKLVQFVDSSANDAPDVWTAVRVP